MAEAGTSSGLLAVRLVSPDRLLLDATAEAVELPSRAGYLETLYGAAPLLAELGAGEVRLHGGSCDGQIFFVAWGFVEVLPERVTILAETALRPDEIDHSRGPAGARWARSCGRRLATTIRLRPSTRARFANAMVTVG
jgi:F-type H+-transporting ATPase subunit epsilon